MQDFINRLPKVEMHLHIEGTLEPELMFHLASRNGVALEYPTVEALRAAYEFDNLQSFLDIYYRGNDVLRTADDFSDLMEEYLRRAVADGVRHAEIFFDPQAHTSRGVPFQVFMEGFARARHRAERELGITSDLIMCFLRHLSGEEAAQTLREAQPHLAEITAVGLDSSEVGHPPSKFAEVFASARKLGLRVVAHAGEEGPPSYISEALDVLEVERVDHGVRAEEDPDLLKRLVRDGITLTMCPLSNVKLRVFKRLEDHNLKRMLDAGVAVTINSDDPAYFGGYIGDNYLKTALALGLSHDDLRQIASNSVVGSFLDDDRKQQLLTEIAAVS